MGAKDRWGVKAALRVGARVGVEFGMGRNHNDRAGVDISEAFA